MTTLAILTVGTQEIQSDWLSVRVTERLGPDVRVQGRPVGDELGTLDDDDLAEVLSDATVRNGPCFQALDQRHDDWALALLATDQPADVPQRVGDTIDIAKALVRWLGITRPRVTVLEPYVVAHRPDLPDDQLAATIHAHVVDAVTRTAPDHIAVLPVGGTPAMRLLTERAAGLITDLPGTVTTLLPDPAARGQVIDTTVMRLLRRDQARPELAGLVREAVRGARYQAARHHIEAMRRLGFRHEAAELAERVADIETAVDQGDWPERLAARIALVDRLERDGRLGDALVHATIAAELLPLVWARRTHGIADVRPHIVCRDRPCERRDRARYKWPAHMLAEPGHQPPSEVDTARGIAVCALVRCNHCPLRQADPPVQHLWDDTGGARRAAWLRDADRNRHPLVAARHDYTHPDRGHDLDLAAVLAQEHQALADADIDTPPAITSISHLLRVVHRGVVGDVPDDPLDGHEACIDELLDRVGHAPG